MRAARHHDFVGKIVVFVDEYCTRDAADIGEKVVLNGFGQGFFKCNVGDGQPAAGLENAGGFVHGLLRVEGVVVERLDGIDDLAAVVREFEPGLGRRLGVLVDHLVPGSKEARIAETVRDPNVLVLGTPYVDVWQAVRPAAVGIEAWPVIPKGTPWKEGVAAALG